MLSVQTRRTGGPEVLEIVEGPVFDPGPEQIRIRHKAIGLNFIDTYQRSGLYPLKMPATLGQEAAGVVEVVGAAVTRFKPGDRVGYAGVMGAYAETNVISADRAVRLPDGVPFEIAAAGLLKGMTAEFLLRRCYPVKAGETILVHAAAGGVGGLLSQWAKALGARVIGAVGSSAKIETARAQGCEEVIVYDVEPMAPRIKALTGGQGVAVVYDGVGADTFEASLGCLARRGMMVSFGAASGPAPAVEPSRLARGGSLYLTRPSLWDYIVTTEELDASAAALFHVLATGVVKIGIGQTFPLRETRQAHEALEARRTTGATVLLP